MAKIKIKKIYKEQQRQQLKNINCLKSKETNFIVIFK